MGIPRTKIFLDTSILVATNMSQREYIYGLLTRPLYVVFHEFFFFLLRVYTFMCWLFLLISVLYFSSLPKPINWRAAFYSLMAVERDIFGIAGPTYLKPVNWYVVIAHVIFNTVTWHFLWYFPSLMDWTFLGLIFESNMFFMFNVHTSTIVKTWLPL
jgi:hypothetical protein